MQITEFPDRILRVHWKLITALLLAGIVAGFSLHRNEEPTYTASARVLLDTDTPEPTSETEARAIADTARAIVTSPTFVEEALSKADLSRSATGMVLEERISVSTVGSSGVVEVAVIDRDPAAASELANTLAEDLISTRLRSTTGALDDALAEIQARIPALETALDALNARIPRAPDDSQESLSKKRDLLIQRLVILEQKAGDLLAARAERPAPQIIDPARRPAEPEPSRRMVDAVLGGLLGLFLGISLSVILERFRPTVVGGPAVSRELDAPLLGSLRKPPHRAQPDEIAPLAAWLSTAAESAAVRTVALVGTRREDGVEGLAAELSEHIAGDYPLHIRPMDLAERGNGGPRKNIAMSAGIVVVTPAIARKTDLAAVRDLFGMTGHGLLGAIAYRGSGYGHAARRVRSLLLGKGRPGLAALSDERPKPRKTHRRGKVRGR